MKKLKKAAREITKRLDDEVARSARLRHRLEEGGGEAPPPRRTNGRSDERPSTPDLVAEPT